MIADSSDNMDPLLIETKNSISAAITELEKVNKAYESDIKILQDFLASLKKFIGLFTQKQ